MNASFEQVVAKVAELPEEQQAYIAHTIMELIEDEAWWDRQFASSHDAADRLADEALAELEDDEDTQEILAGIREGLLDIKNGNVMTWEELEVYLASDEEDDD